MDAQKVATGFVYLLMSQVASRLVTFGLNLLVARHLTPDAYGLSFIQLHLLVTTIMMLSREGFRRGCLRLKQQDDSGTVEAWRVLRIAWLVLPTGLLVSTVACGITLYRHQSGSQKDAIQGYGTSIILHGVAAIVELASEPLYILASINMQYKQRLLMDSAPLAAKSLLTLGCVAGWLGPKAQSCPPALVFAYAQLAFAAVTLIGYLATVGLPLLTSSGKERAGSTHKSAGSTGKAAGSTQHSAGSSKAETAGGPAAKQGWAWTAEERHVLASTAVFSMQSAVKLVLAEGSKLVLSQVSSGTAQGVVGLVSNLGSLVVRTLFQPLEEVAFTAFSRQNAASRESQALRQQLLVLRIMVKAVSLLGLLAIVFGPPNTWLAIRLVYGRLWASTEAPSVLSVYCFYILLLAINGVTEAFVHAVLDNKKLAGSNLLLLAPTAIHLLACVLLIQRLGSVGFVVADAANMAIRIVISLWYIQRHFRALHGFSAVQLLVPGRMGLLLVMAAAHLTLQGSKAILLPKDPHAGLPSKPVALHLAVNVLLLGLVLSAVLRSERETISAIKALSRKEHSVTGSEQTQDASKVGHVDGKKTQ